MSKTNGLLWLILGLCQVETSFAEVSFDRSAIVPTPAQGRTLSGQMLIRPEFGKQIGTNLFHSFASFNINKNESAIFTGSGVNNIIGRVTGGSGSRIDGLLRSAVPGANLFLLNPNGFVFGKDAVLDVSGSFHVSTAAYLDFKKDNFRFEASGRSGDDLLKLKGSPAAFGFLDDSPATVGTIVVNGARLQTAHNSSLSLSAGNIELLNNPNLSVEGGQIRLIANQGQNRVIVDGDVPRTKPLPNTTQAKLVISDSSLSRAAKIDLAADTITITGSEISATNLRLEEPDFDQGINLRANRVSLRQASVISSATQEGNAGNVLVRANAVQIADGAILASIATATAKGKAGSVLVDAARLSIGRQALPSPDKEDPPTQGAGIAPKPTLGLNLPRQTKARRAVPPPKFNSLVLGGVITPAPPPRGGGVSITAKDLSVDYLNSNFDTGIAAYTQNENGTTGTVGINATKITLGNGGYIATSTPSGAIAGGISISTKNLAIAGGLITSFSQKGNAGNIKINSENLSIKAIGNNNTTGISSFIERPRNPSSTEAPENTDVLAESKAGDIRVNTGRLHIKGTRNRQFTGIFTNSVGSGHKGQSGKIDIDAKSIELLQGGTISSESNSDGKSGDILVKAGQITVDALKNISGITGINADTGGSGNGGDIEVFANSLNIHNGGEISSSTDGAGNVGPLSFRVENLVIDGQNSGRPTGIFSAASDSSKAIASPVLGGIAAIDADTTNLILRNGGSISTTTRSNHNSRPIKLDAEQLVVNASTIESRTFADGNAGDILINTRQLFYALNKGLVATSAITGKTNGGNIGLTSLKFVLLDDSNIIAQAVEGKGGNIGITANFFLPSSDSLIDASSKLGINGELSINSANSNIAGSLSVLPDNFLDASSFMFGDCGMSANNQGGSLMGNSVQGLVLASPDDDTNTLPTGMGTCLPKPLAD